MTTLRLRTALVALALLGGACGKTKPLMNKSDGGGGSTTADGGGGTGGSSSDGGVKVSVSGVATPHPLTVMLDPTASFSMLQVSVVDPVTELAAGPPLATMALSCGAAGGTDGGGAGGSTGDGAVSDAHDGGAGDAATGDAAETGATEAGATEAGATEAGGSDAMADGATATDGGAADHPATAGGTGCPWSFPSVDISKISLGLVAKLEDLRPAASSVWLKTGTGAGAASFIMMEQTTKAPITMRQAFAVSRVTEGKLAAFAGATLGTTLAAGDLEKRGFMIGHVVGKLSAGPLPVAGATVSVAAGAVDKVDIIYPDATFMGKGTATASHGMFLVVPKATTPAMPVVTTWTVKPPTGDTRVWDVYTAGTSPGAAFVIILFANE